MYPLKCPGLFFRALKKMSTALKLYNVDLSETERIAIWFVIKCWHGTCEMM